MRQMNTIAKFQLPKAFLKDQRPHQRPMDGLGTTVFMRTYSRMNPDTGHRETFPEVVQRVVEGATNMRKRHLARLNLPWNEKRAQEEAQDMYVRMIQHKFLPPGRGLWMMGTKMTDELHQYAGLNNCGFVSTYNSEDDSPVRPFTWLMDALMFGTGVGFDVEGHDKIFVDKKDATGPPIEFVVPDTRDGWVESMRLLLSHYFDDGPAYTFDYSKIRPAGEPLKTFGGIAPGPDPLIKLHRGVTKILEGRLGQYIGITALTDIMNMIGACVVSGNVRRSSEIALGPADSDEFLNLKNYEMNPIRQEWGWASNNSVKATPGMDYSSIAKSIQVNGEPGVVWMHNIRKHGRMNGKEADWKDAKVGGCNPW